MHRYVCCVACVLLMCSGVASGADDAKGKSAGGEKKGAGGEEKVISGMSIVGNNETPKALVIVPWKSSEIGQETKLKSDLLNDGLSPVDHEVFMRELNFYRLANPR